MNMVWNLLKEIQKKLYDTNSGSEYNKLKQKSMPTKCDLIIRRSTDGAQIANIVVVLYYCNHVHLTWSEILPYRVTSTTPWLHHTVVGKVIVLLDILACSSNLFRMKHNTI